MPYTPARRQVTAPPYFSFPVSFFCFSQTDFSQSDFTDPYFRRAPVDLTGLGSRPRFAVNDAPTRNHRHQMVQRQMSTEMLVRNIGRENPLASEKRAFADEKGALRQGGGKIKPHRNRRTCPDAVGVDKNHAEKLLPPLWRSRLLYGLSGANATGRGRQTDFFAIRRKRSHLAPAFPPAASRRDGGNGV